MQIFTGNVSKKGVRKIFAISLKEITMKREITFILTFDKKSFIVQIKVDGIKLKLIDLKLPICRGE